MIAYLQAFYLNTIYKLTPFSQPVSFKAGSVSFFRKSASDNEAAFQFTIASSGTTSTGVCQEVEVSLLVIQIKRFFSSHHLAKRFTSYVNEVRLNHASTLRIETKKTVIDISLDCGFGNLSNFNRQFRKVYNKSPLQFKKQYHLSPASG